MVESPLPPCHGFEDALSTVHGPRPHNMACSCCHGCIKSPLSASLIKKLTSHQLNDRLVLYRLRKPALGGSASMRLGTAKRCMILRLIEQRDIPPFLCHWSKSRVNVAARMKIRGHDEEVEPLLSVTDGCLPFCFLEHMTLRSYGNVPLCGERI